VRGGHFSALINAEARIVDLVLALVIGNVGRLRHTATNNVGIGLLGEAAEHVSGHGLFIANVDRLRTLVHIVTLGGTSEDLWQHDHIGALISSLADHTFSSLQIFLLVGAGLHLDERHLELAQL